MGEAIRDEKLEDIKVRFNALPLNRQLVLLDHFLEGETSQRIINLVKEKQKVIRQKCCDF